MCSILCRVREQNGGIASISRWEDEDYCRYECMGLGIDISDIRMVVHIGGLFNLMNYEQELGRAELDRKRLEAIVLVTEENI